MGVLKMYPSQRQALEELLDAGDDMARVIQAMFTGSATLYEDADAARRDWQDLRKRHEGRIDRLKNR